MHNYLKCLTLQISAKFSHQKALDLTPNADLNISVRVLSKRTEDGLTWLEYVA